MDRRLYFIALAIVVLATPAGAQEAHQHHGHHPPAQEDEPLVCHDLDHGFADAELWSERFDSAERAAWQKPDEVIALMRIEPRMTAVDIGAGTGYFLGYLAAAVGEDGKVLGLDVEPNLVDFMKKRAESEGWANVEPRRIPFDDPELADASVDRVLIVNTWHHIQEREAYAAKLLAALKPDGRLYVVDLNKESPTGPPPEHRLEPRQIMAELQAGGFRVKLAEETLPNQFIVVGRRP